MRSSEKIMELEEAKRHAEASSRAATKEMETLKVLTAPWVHRNADVFVHFCYPPVASDFGHSR